jgi:hypothetical protein
MNIPAFHGKLKGKGRRFAPCAGCGRIVDLTRDRCFLGNGGWRCGECGEKERAASAMGTGTAVDASQRTA